MCLLNTFNSRLIIIPEPGRFTLPVIVNTYPALQESLFRRVNMSLALNVLSLSLSVLTGIFPGGPGLAGTRMSPFWFLLELWVTEVVVTTGAIRRAKLQSNFYHQQTNTQLFTG